MALYWNFHQEPFSFHSYKQGASLHWSAQIQRKTSNMHWPTTAYLCYSCHFVTLPRPLQPDVQEHSASLNTLHLLIHKASPHSELYFWGAGASLVPQDLPLTRHPPNKSPLSKAWGQFSFVLDIPVDLLVS